MSKDKDLIIGSGGGGGKGGGGGATRAAKEAKNTLHSIQYAEVLDLVSEGEIEGLVDGFRSIYFNGTQLENEDGTFNYADVSLYTRNGTQNQSIIPGFTDVESERVVDVEVKKGTPGPLVRTITDVNVDRARVTVRLPALRKQNTKNGDVSGSSVNMTIEYQANGGGYVPAKINTRNVSAFVTSQGSSNPKATSSGNAISFSASAVWNRPQIGTKTVYVEETTNTFFGRRYTRKTIAIYGGSRITAEVQYKTTAAGSWTTHSTITIDRSGASNTTSSRSRNVTISDLPEDTYEVRLVKQSGSGSLSWSGATFQQFTGNFTIRGKTNNAYLRAWEFPLEGTAPFDIRVTRNTADSDSASLVNATFWDSYTEIITTKFNYPNSALVGIRIDSSQFNSIPTRGYDIKGLKVQIPTNYDPASREYTGLWDGTFQVMWTDNPAWCLYDLIINDRYGLGTYIESAEIDKWRFYELATYCDELVPDGVGGEEPRFTMNAYIQTRTEAITLLQNLAAIFRGKLYWSNNALTPIYDHPQDAIASFTNSNVIDGIFSYTGSSLKSRHTVAQVTWNDPEDLYKQKIEYVEDQEQVSTRGLIVKDVSGIGITSQGQAHRLGKWLLFTEKNETDVIAFKSALEFHAVQPGDVIEVFDKNKANVRLGGRIVSGTTTSITVDNEVEILDGFIYTLSIVIPEKRTETLPNGDPITYNTPKVETRVLNNTQQSDNANVTVLSWDDPLSTAPLANATWGLSQSGVVESQLFQVLSVVEDEPGIYEISGVEYNASKYANVEDNIDLQVRPSVSSRDISPLPTNITISEELYTDSQGVKTKLIIEWEAAITNAIAYNIQLSQDDNNFQQIAVNNPSRVYEVLDVTPGLYTARVQSVNSLGNASIYVESEETEIFGKTAPPSDVTGFTITKRPSDLLITWDPISDLDFSHFEIRKGTSWDSGVEIVKDFAGTMHVTDESEPGTYFFHIKSFDTSGNESRTVTTTSITLERPATVNGFLAVQSRDRIELDWLRNNEQDLVGYEIREGTVWETAVNIATVDVNYFSLVSGSTATREFLIKAIVSPGIVSETAASTTTAVALPPDRNIVQTFDEYSDGFTESVHYAFLDSGDLRMNANQQYSEYAFSVKLNDLYYAQNTLYRASDVIATDNDTWQQATWAWNDSNADRFWRVAGNENLTSVDYQLSLPNTTVGNEIEAFRFDNDTDSIDGTTANTASGTSFGIGRYGGGLSIDDLTTVDYTGLSIPSEFNLKFWYIPDQIVDVNICSLRNSISGDTLTLRYDSTANELQLVNNVNSDKVLLSRTNVVDERLYIGIIQTATELKLYVGNLLDNSYLTSTESYTPLGTWDEFRLY